MYKNFYIEQNFEGFIYLDTEFAPAAWNAVKGFFCSVDIIKKRHENNNFISFSHAQMLKYNPKRLDVELRLEYIRKNYFPYHVSRFDGLFIFDEIESISETWKYNNWGGHFKLDCLTDVGVASNRSSRVDANWITNIQDSDNNIKENWQEMAMNYWSGNPYPHSSPIWERIIEGYITIWGRDIKEKSHEFLKKYFPHSLNILAYYINCNTIPSTCGQNLPYITTKNGVLRIEYYIDEYDKLDPSFNERLINAVSKNPEKSAIYYNKDEVMRLPDFSEYITEIKINSNDNKAYIGLDENLNLISNLHLNN